MNAACEARYTRKGILVFFSWYRLELVIMESAKGKVNGPNYLGVIVTR